MSETDDPLDILGDFLMRNLRDRGIAFFDALSQGRWKAPALLPLQRELGAFSDEQRAAIRRAVIRSIDTAIHDLLFALQEAHDRDGQGVQLLVNGENPAAISDGLQGELFTEDGWYQRFSKFGEQQ